MVAAEAITVHKAQGSTMKSVVIVPKDTRSGKSLTRKALYVAMSRATSLNGLYIIGKFKAPAPIDPNDKAVKQMTRLRNEKLLKTKYQFLKDFDRTQTIQVYSHNIQSLPKHLNCISSDYVAKKSDLICLQETWAKDNENYVIAGYTEVIRNKTNQNYRGRGTIIYCKTPNETQGSEQIYLFNNRTHIEITYTFFKDILIINIYFSAGLTKSTIDAAFNKTLRDKISNSSNILVLGDVNKDHLKNSMLERYLGQQGISLISVREPTTLSGSMIDVVYGRLQNYSCTVTTYDAYYSFHRPIVCQLTRK